MPPSMRRKLDWSVLTEVLDGQLHPGGEVMTERTLEAADIGREDRVLDLGCGPTARGAVAGRWVGLDTSGDAGVQGDGRRLPVTDGSVDVVLSECALSLMRPVEAALGEVRRALRPTGRLVFSDFTAHRRVEWVAPELARWACVEDVRPVGAWRDLLGSAGFASVDVEDHSWALSEIEERVLEKIDVFGLLDALSASGDPVYAQAQAFLDQARRLRDDGTLGYHLFVADVDAGPG